MIQHRNIYKLSFILLSFISISALAQDATDALRYSYLTPMGTARSMGFGSALGSVGGDFSALSINPAGIGIYRSSEVVFTPSLKIKNVNGNYLQNTVDDNITRVNFNNLGIVFTRSARGKRYENSDWKTFSFGIGVNRLADFNRNYTYKGLMRGEGNEYSSFSEIFSNDANTNPDNVNFEGTLANLGYQSYLIDQDANGYFTLANWETGLNQTRSVEERGGINEIVFSFGGNYQEKFMIGATLGVPTINYTRDSYFEETDASGSDTNFFQAFRYNESLQTSGLGVNLKFGMIFKPNDNFRFGLALHTPTWYSVSEVYNNSLTANTEDFKQFINPLPADLNPTTTVNGPENLFNYRLTTPWRGILSAMALIGQYGFITADYEYVDYRSIRYNFENDFTNAESIRNQDIKELYQAAFNIRLGIEGRINDNFFVRGGFGYYGSPYKNNVSGMSRINISTGLGYRTERFFTDIGFVHTRLDEYEQPYSLPAPVSVPSAKLENRFNNIAFSFGWKF